jgi:tRNA A-37 threonylcarbamoyl transferase component Bud32
MTAVSPEPAPATPPQSATPVGFDLTNKTLGEFRIVRRIGKGGMAEVYLADQTSLNRQVAIKVLRPEFLSDATYVKRFRHEATAAGGLNHPNIVQVYSIGEQEGMHFIAQEYVRGGNLRDFMRKKGALELPIVLHIMKQVAAALQVAGTAGIVHRDIKPENILLTKKGEAKVADFGLAQLTQGGERVALTQVGITMGTPLYMSPEQVGGKQVDQRSDLYSFGAMAYHMLAGRPPFQGENALAVAVQHLNDKPKPIKELRNDLPGPVCDLINRLMAKKKEDRYPDAQSLLGDLKALQKQFSSRDAGSDEAAFSTLATTGSHPLKRKLLDRPFHQQALLFALCGALVLGAGAGYGWTNRLGDPFATPAPAEPEIERLPTIAAQYFYAMCRPNNEAAWKAVVNYQAADPTQGKMERQFAELRLAILYLQQNRLDLADQIFQRLQNDGSTDPWKKAHGRAGEAIIKSLRGDVNGSKRAIDLLDRDTEVDKIDAKLNLLLQETRERNSRKKT